MIEIRQVYGYYELYIDGEFICSADTYSEAKEDLYYEMV